ncbi:MAG: hypothetical protein M3Z57_04900 [Candidatus Dormibacteraeota bacterium]|nr:hypothetical protein [Candidatus Dormibacteraeota bacterium]
MTAATGLSDSSTPSSAEPVGSSEGVTDSHEGAIAVLADGDDRETRHRLRRALRILTAARRRDEGASGQSES